MDQLVEISRLLQNLLRFGTVASVDHAAGTCTVATGALVTRPMPWLVQRAGDARTWWAPSIGEQVVLLCPGGDTARGVVQPAIYSSSAPRAAGSDTAKTTHYPDGALVSYDPQTHQLTATLPAGGKTTIASPGGVSITGDTTIIGKLSVSDDTTLSAKLHVASDVTVDTTLTASADVVGGGKSVKGHKHPETGTVTGAPQ
ncbi:MAG TPA: phage baseplate assembly protein V [Rhodanobacter sp.]|jgi:phage baseplate assembly protein V|nr:phage baseplate assembly protein V [Rhodanobacter sp.]